MQEIIKKVKNEARKYFIGASGCHDWTHVERVRNLAMRIGKEESADLFVLEIASYLHDIGRKEEMKVKGKFCHAELGAKEAEVILAQFKIDNKNIENILHCIITHRYRNNHKPETIEAKCLYDADKLDSLGAIGVARAFLFAGHSASNILYTGNEKKLAKLKKNYSFTKEDTVVLEWEVKLRYIKNKMFTMTGENIAKSRHDFMDNFFKEFWLEVGGEK